MERRDPERQGMRQRMGAYLSLCLGSKNVRAVTGLQGTDSGP
jgi:hypothetical protein